MIINPHYAWLAARLRLPLLSPPTARFGGVTFTVEPEHYQLRGVFKQRAIEPVLAQLLSLCDADTLVLDIGANVGLFALLLASQTGAKVIAFEPVRSTFQALVRNCFLNPNLDVAALNLALGRDTSTVEITALRGSGINQVVTEEQRLGDPRQWVPQAFLDQLDVEKWMIMLKRLVIKMDVERYEFQVLAGAQKLLASDHPIALCIEVPPEDRPRLEGLLPKRFQAFNPPQAGTLPVMTSPDPSNLFYANDDWLRGA